MSTIISKKNSKTSLKEIFQSRYLILQLAKRDFSVRYKQTSLGWLWAVINPLITFLLFTFVFGLLVKVPTPEYSAPYSAILLVGIIFWNFFASSLTAVSDSLVNNIGLIKKTYFPRIVFGLASVFVAFVDLIIALVFFVPVLMYLNININVWKIALFVPFCVITTLFFSWGLGSWIAILKVKYKDFRHIIPLLMQVLFFASPIVYTASIIPAEYKDIYDINPMTHIVSVARYALLDSIILPNLLVTFISSLAIAILGSLYFSFNERKVVDLE
ncbi:ABC transporter permease [Photorhabdus bodei]|uniref:Transport permease protein n=1 Tax=Photorhabdus bodei TaxID=2029681 RepID=A0A329XBU9_9GAMM|nr:ABC transporter permease [Photorhabdus bodei]RAX12818.1 ABC transporter [Photorhabdus bodei]